MLWPRCYRTRTEHAHSALSWSRCLTGSRVIILVCQEREPRDVALSQRLNVSDAFLTAAEFQNMVFSRFLYFCAEKVSFSNRMCRVVVVTRKDDYGSSSPSTQLFNPVCAADNNMHPSSQILLRGTSPSYAMPATNDSACLTCFTSSLKFRQLQRTNNTWEVSRRGAALQTCSFCV
jgi:hypothetical protein